MARMTEVQEIVDLIGDPNEVDKELQSFRKTAMRLSSRYPRMIELYPQQWIALHSGKVRAQGDSLESVLDKIDSMGLSREQTIIRFIESEPRTMLL